MVVEVSEEETVQTVDQDTEEEPARIVRFANHIEIQEKRILEYTTAGVTPRPSLRVVL